jgi:hypothetical protein
MDHHQRSVNKFTSDDRFFSAIGRFIFEFSQLEYTLKHYIAEAIDLRDEHFNPIMTQDFAMLCKIAETVLLQDNQQTSNLEFTRLGQAPQHVSERYKQASEDVMEKYRVEKNEQLETIQRTDQAVP